MSFGIELNGFSNEELFSELCETVDIDEKCFKLIEKDDLYWAWEVKPEYKEMYKEYRSEIKKILSKWIDQKKVKYASW
jgi:phage anti-repressor protein